MDSLSLLLRVALSLGAVLGLVWMVRRGMLRQGGPSARAAVGSIQVLSRQQLSGRASVALVQVGGVGLVLGVTDGAVSVLDSRPVAELLPPEGEHPAAVTVRRTPLAVQDVAPVPLDAAAGAATAGAAVADEPPATRRAARQGRSTGPTGPAGALAGSVLSPTTWHQAVDVLRERTSRR